MNHYDVLEVSPKASSEVIRAAYKSLMQRYHPDKNPNTTESQERAPLIALAYDVLSNPDKRLAYDRELVLRTLAVRPVAGQKPLQAASGMRSWYAWLLILCITGAGGMILVLSKKTKAPGPAAQESRPVAARETGVHTKEADAGGPASDALQARMIPAFVTHLSITLTPLDQASSNVAHVLQIPDLSLRVATGDPARWVQKIEMQREALIRQLLVKLASAQYDELIKADGDLYLKRRIEETVGEAIGLEKSTPVPSSSALGQAPQLPLEALLPQSYSVR